MKRKRKSPVAVKVIACLLLLGSLACLLLPWMKLSADTPYGRMNPGELLQNYLGLDEASVISLTRSELTREGIPAEEGAVTRLLTRFLDGHFSLVDFPVFCGDLAAVFAAAGEQDLVRALSAARLALWILAGLMAVLGLVALICQLTDHRGGILPFLLLGILVLAALYFLRAQANQYLREEGAAMLDEMGVGILIGYYGIDLEVVKMGIGALLCPFLALLALLLMGIRKKEPEPEVSPYPARRAPAASAAGIRGLTESDPVRPGWHCPNCGRVCHPDSTVCDLCGTLRPRRPAAPTCPACGARMPRGASFCAECGAALQEQNPGFDLSGEDRL